MHENDELTARARRAARTREAIIDAARVMISRDGAQALSLRAIARAIDYSPAGLYEYFSGKDEIIAAVINDGFNHFGDYLLAIDPALPAAEYLRELGLAYLRFAAEKPQHFMLIFNNVQLSPIPRHEDMVAHGTYAALVNALQRCLDEGVIAPHHRLNDLVIGTWGFVHGIATLRITQQLPALDEDWPAAMRRMLAMWQAGMQHG